MTISLYENQGYLPIACYDTARDILNVNKEVLNILNISRNNDIKAYSIFEEEMEKIYLDTQTNNSMLLLDEYLGKIGLVEAYVETDVIRKFYGVC